MTINVKKRLSVSLFFTLMSTFLSSYEVVAHTMPPSLAKKDFSLQIKDQIVALGDRWTPEIARKIAVSVEGSFVGEVPFDGTSYKFYQHQKTGLKIFSSNLWWDKTERSVDDYIVAQITLTATDGKTARGIHIGSTLNELNKAYGAGQVENDSGEQWVSYELGKKLLSFEVKDSKVVKITMNYDNDSLE
ncbi:hypothetical protein JGT96_21870 [Enterobacter hormaechei]|uniref:hypothetical protein n=1 Tax=Enterobacter hormaechei TaxID=158836 RepID=UPI0015C55AF5|nr:hypothetical protein [Enterobacter hormaechei]EKW1332940.1 hypothetical protein [Enterobacter hormaechei]MBJ6430745.1 hypothetical protein [Enterobacter hormaechei]MBJ6593273.1 hypothetical protein [Enterobacter hormaechei]MBK4246450.1 hypothetical protein [Enterobacter hormaechei]MBK4313448.1 hypothetical protein [Enterobacter hormaechei]